MAFVKDFLSRGINPLDVISEKETALVSVYSQDLLLPDDTSDSIGLLHRPLC